MANYSSCQATSNIELGCAGSVGGVARIYVLSGEVTGTTLNGDGAYTSIAGTGTTYIFEVQKQTSNLTETFNISLENGTTFFEQVTTAVFNKIDQDKRNQLKLLSRNRQIVLFVEDNNGTIYYLGSDFDGGYMSAGSGETGTAFGDRNGYSVSISTYSKEPMSSLADTLANVLSGISIA